MIGTAVLVGTLYVLTIFISTSLPGSKQLAKMDETEPSVREILFGTVPERIVKATDVPVIVVRHEDEAIDAAEQSMEAGSS